MRGKAVCVLAGVWLAGSVVVAGQEEGQKPKDHKAIEILQKMDAACQAVQAVRYEITVEGLGDMKDRLVHAEATVTLRGSTAASGRAFPKEYFVDAKVRLPGASTMKHIAGGSDGETYFVIDHDAKRVHAGTDPAVLGTSLRFLMAPWMIEFVTPEPYADELKGQAQELKGEQKIGDVTCHELYVVYAEPQAPAVTWFVSTKDFLPRARVDHFTLPDGTKGAMRKTITKLEVDPQLAADAFALRVPEGFTKTDAAAP